MNEIPTICEDCSTKESKVPYWLSRNIVEGAPVKDKQGNEWRTCKPGPTIFYVCPECKKGGSIKADSLKPGTAKQDA